VTTPPASPESPAPSAIPPEPHRRQRARKIAKWTALSLVAVLVLAAGGLVADYYYINSKVTKVGTYIPQGVRPTKAATALKAENFVLIGSDTRAGKSGKGTGGHNIAGARSDTTIILHISAQGSGATLVSIPRDSYVQIPSCEIGSHGQMSSPTMGKFNEAYSIGANAGNQYAPSCTVHTIESLTGIRVDHFAVVDFAGFERMVEALGGVKMCVAHRLYDPIVDDDGAYHGSGLNLPAGQSVEINGSQALALMRARYALDGGGDLPRIKRQQQFIGAMIRKATSTGLLIHPLELQHFLVAAASSVTTDGFSLGTMRKLASALHNVGAGGVRLLTVPNLTTYPGMPYGDVEWDPSKAPALWQAIRNDQPIPGSKPTSSPSPSPTPTGPKLSVSPSSITVNVLNGTSDSGLAHRVSSALQSQGFQIGTVGDAPTSTNSSTIVKYGSEKVQSSQTVAASIPGSVRRSDPTSANTVTVIIGSNYTKVVPVKITGGTPSSTPTPKISSFSAAKNGCLS
jgi:LCP family protein required for cell wall assembly